MARKSAIILESTKNDFVFQFHIPVGASLGSAYDAAYECLYEITQMVKESTEKAKPKNASSEEEVSASTDEAAETKN